MAEFISNKLDKQNTPLPSYKNKIKVNLKDLDFTYLISNDTGKNYVIKYIVMINPKAYQIEPGTKLTPRNVDMVSLRNSIISWLKPRDRKYFTLSKFDTRHAEFTFNHDKWLRDATSGMKPRVHYSKFDREFRLKVPPPYLIMTDNARFQFEEFIIRKFKDWLEKSRKEAKYFKYLFPKNMRRKIRTKIRNMFDWSYDFQWNRIISVLKTIYILALLYAVGAATKKLTTSNIQKSQKDLFSVKVKEKIKKFDKKKWEKYIRKKGFV